MAMQQSGAYARVQDPGVYAHHPQAGALTRLPRRPVGAAELHEHFAPQHTATSALPDPAPLLHNLTRGVLEVLAGVRKSEQVARWLTEDAYRKLVVRANLATRARSARGVPAARPKHTITALRYSSPADGVVEAVVIVTTPPRTRAVAIRLEGMDRRWRATCLAIL